MFDTNTANRIDNSSSATGVAAMLRDKVTLYNRIGTVVTGIVVASATIVFAITGTAQASYQAFDASIEDPGSVEIAPPESGSTFQNLPWDDFDAEIVMGIRSTDESHDLGPAPALAYQGDETDEPGPVMAFAYHGDEGDDVRPPAGLAYHGDENDAREPVLPLAYHGDESDDVRNPVLVVSYQGDENDSAIA